MAGVDPAWLLVGSIALAGIPIVLAWVRTVPSAVRLGRRVGTPAEQTRLAQSIWRDHLLCVACMLAFTALWVVNG